MVDLTRTGPPHGPPKTDVERLLRLRHLVLVAAHNEAVKSADCMLFSGMATAGAIVTCFCGLLFVDHSPNAAWWFCLMAIVLLVLNFAFNPIQKGRLHSVYEGRLREFEASLDAMKQPLDAVAITRHERHADRLIRRLDASYN